MRKTLTGVLIFLSLACHAQDAFITFNREKYNPGDSLRFECNLQDYTTDDTHLASLYLFIENIATRQRWSYRYPLVNGSGTGLLLMDSALSPGKYAFSFLVRKSFFSIRGKVEKEKATILTYSMITKNKTSFSDKITTDKNGRFFLHGLLFEDSSDFVFLPDWRKTQTGLKMNIVTALDSIFESDKTYTRILDIGNGASVVNDTAVAEAALVYKPNMLQFIGKTTLPDVTVSTRLKKKVAIFNEEFSSGLFRTADERIFDGLEDDHIARNTSILDFFRSQMPYMWIRPLGNRFVLLWRDPVKIKDALAPPPNSNVDIFIDEIQLPDELITEHFIDPSTIAMIKVYNPPAYFTPFGNHAAIAIYTKRPGYENEHIFKNRFRIYGYSSPVMVWK